MSDDADDLRAGRLSRWVLAVGAGVVAVELALMVVDSLPRLHTWNPLAHTAQGSWSGLFYLVAIFSGAFAITRAVLTRRDKQRWFRARGLGPIILPRAIVRTR